GDRVIPRYRDGIARAILNAVKATDTIEEIAEATAILQNPGVDGVRIVIELKRHVGARAIDGVVLRRAYVEREELDSLKPVGDVINVARAVGRTVRCLR